MENKNYILFILLYYSLEMTDLNRESTAEVYY